MLTTFLSCMGQLLESLWSGPGMGCSSRQRAGNISGMRTVEKILMIKTKSQIRNFRLTMPLQDIWDGSSSA